MNTFTPLATQIKDTNDYTVEDLQNIIATAKSEASQAASEWLAQWVESTGGNQYGEPMYCGFASVNIHGIKGNTKLGKRMKAAGLVKDYSGAYSIWNPAGYGGQSMDVKEAGASACARVLEAYGFRAYANSRAD
jgi:hypothetical protein